MIATSNEGPQIAGVLEHDCPLDIEMAAFDALGPETRRVLRDVMLVKWSAFMTLKFAKTLGSPTAPMVDRRMAAMLCAHNKIIAEKVARSSE